MEFRVLGGVGAFEQGEQLSLGGPRQRSVLAVLLCEPGEVVPADRIVTEVWGDHAPDGAKASLHTNVSNLRSVVGRDRLERADRGYRLHLRSGDSIDYIQFELRAQEARGIAATDPIAAIDVFEEALSNWRGVPFDGHEDVSCLAAEAARLVELRAAVEMDRHESLLDAGSSPEVGEVEQLCTDRPLDERLRAIQMRTLYRRGRQVDALRVFAEVRRQFVEELGIEPSPALAKLEEQILLHDKALEGPSPDGSGALRSYLTSFVGRERELALLRDRVRERRLITVTGPGGVGKTRLASVLADELRSTYPDGVWSVDLALLDDPDRLGLALASSLRIAVSAPESAVDEVAAALAGRIALVLLDNCEHLHESVSAAALRVLERAPHVTILATSRVPLELPGEQRFRLDGLAVGAEEEAIGEAERLFLDRAEALGTHTVPDGAELEAVRTICNRLDGLPLALELAAGRSDLLSTHEIAGLLTEQMEILVDESRQRDVHRSMAAAIDWSYGLLESNQQVAFEALGAFEGPFTAGAAAAVWNMTSMTTALDMLEQLVAVSLVEPRSTDDAPTLYRLYETLRLHARGKLQKHGGESEVLSRHNAHYHTRCQELRADFFGSGRVDATARVAEELAEYVAVWDREMWEQPEAVLELVWPLAHYWLFDGALADGERRIDAALEATTGVDSLARADALTSGAFLIVYRNRVPQAVEWLDEALAIYRRAGDAQRLAHGLTRRGHCAFMTGDVESAMKLLGESLEICDRNGFEDGKAWPTVLIGQARLWSGDPDPEVWDLLLEARSRFAEMGETYGQIHADMLLSIPSGAFSIEERVRLATEMVEISARPGGENLMRPVAFHNLAHAVWDMGERERALGLNRLSVSAGRATGADMTLGMGLIQAGTFASELGKAERAATLIGAGLAHFGMDLAPLQVALLRPAKDAALSQLGERRFEELERMGAAMSAREAAEYCLSPQS